MPPVKKNPGVRLQPSRGRFPNFSCSHHTAPNPRLQGLCEKLCLLGSRALFELFAEQLADPTGDLAHRIERFAAINPDALHVTGGDRFPARFSRVAGGRS